MSETVHNPDEQCETAGNLSADALSASDKALLIEFFQLLDEWDRGTEENN